MAVTRTEAVGLMMALVKTVVDAETLHTVWENTDNGQDDQKPDDVVNWCRVNIRHRNGNPSSLSNSGGQKIHRQTGFVFIEIMTPTCGGRVEADRLAGLFEAAFRTRSSLNQKVWYTNVSSREAGQDDGWYKTNTVASFHYDIIQ